MPFIVLLFWNLNLLNKMIKKINLNTKTFGYTLKQSQMDVFIILFS
jgi:hypothetical protein